MKFADVMSRLTERSFNLRGAELLLLKNRASPELRHFCIGVPDVADEVRAFVDVQTDLRGRGTGVNRENSEFTGLQKSPPRRWSSPCHPRSPPATESGWAPCEPPRYFTDFPRRLPDSMFGTTMQSA